jgi:hypothetical protein
MPPNRRPQTAVRRNWTRIGRVQLRARRLLIIAGQVTTSEMARRIYGTQPKPWQLDQVRKSAAKFAVEVERRRSPGAPILWRLK